MEAYIVGAFRARFQAQKGMTEKAAGQLPEELLHVALDENTNSVAAIMKHMAGNLKSRFTDFLASDGEKPDRDRDAEFVDDLKDRAALMALWEDGWGCLLRTLDALSDADLLRTVTIRGQPHSVADALVRALDHQGYHTGQAVQLSRHLAKGEWKTLTIARGQSKQFNEAMRQKFGK